MCSKSLYTFSACCLINRGAYFFCAGFLPPDPAAGTLRLGAPPLPPALFPPSASVSSSTENFNALSVDSSASSSSAFSAWRSAKPSAMAAVM